MTEQYPPPDSSNEPPVDPTAGTPPPPPLDPTLQSPPPASALHQPPPPSYPAYQSAAPPTPGGGPVGQIRGTGFAIAIYIVTLGIYGLYWYYKTHKEMKDHSGQGIGGGLALLLAFLVGIVMPYITSSEVGGLYTRRGQTAPVSATTGLWAFPGALIIVGPIVWFVKTNGALNDYWRSLGVTG